MKSWISLAAVLLTSLPHSDEAGNHHPKQKSDLLALYTFQEGKGRIIRDVSGLKPPWHLKIGRLGNTAWIPGGGLSVQGFADIHSIADSRRIGDALNHSRQVSLEVWIRPEGLSSDGEALIVSLKEGKSPILSLSQKGDDYRVSVRTKHWGKVKTNKVQVSGVVEKKLTHIVFTLDRDGVLKFYKDGFLFPSLVDTVKGQFSVGKKLELVLGGFHSAWRGDFFRVALHRKALTEAEVKRNYQQGPYPDPDDNGNGIPDLVDSLIAHPEGAPFSPPRVFIPSIWVNIPEADQQVTYTSPFAVPFDLTIFHNVNISIPAGTMASRLNPVLTLLDSEDTRIPPLPLDPNQHVLNYFQLFGDLSPGANIRIPFSFEPSPLSNSALRTPDNMRLYRFNESINAWELIPSQENGSQTFYAILDRINGIYAATLSVNVILVNGGLAASCAVHSSPDSCGRISWRNAVRTFRQAIDLAVPGDEIWVASNGGTPYLPTDGTGNNTDRAAFFLLPAGVGVYGGFDGTESTREQRNILRNPTIISGNIGNSTSNLDNSYNLFVGSEGTVLDGFIIRDAYTDVDITALDAIPGCAPLFNRCKWGSGLYVENVSRIEIRNCVFRDNVGLAINPSVPDTNDPNRFGSLGAALFADNVPILIRDCRFIANRTNADGPAITLNRANGAQIINTIFLDNVSDHFGGAVCNGSGDAIYQNCAFWNNTANGLGGAAFEFGVNFVAGMDSTANTVYRNCTFHGNRSLTSFGGAVSSDSGNSGSPRIENSILWGNTAPSGNAQIDGAYTVAFSIVQGGFAGTGNLSTDPQFADETNPLGPDGEAGTLDDGLRLLGTSSPAHNSGNGIQEFDLLNQRRFDTTAGGIGNAPCFTRFDEASIFAFNPGLVLPPTTPCTGLNPDRGAYGITLSENPQGPTTVGGITQRPVEADFIDHPAHRFGFDKIPHDLTYNFLGVTNPALLNVPNEIYFAMKKLTPTSGSTSEQLYVVTPDPTGLFVRSSNTSLFFLNAVNRIDLDRNVTAVELTALNPDTTQFHESAFLEVVRAPNTVVRRLYVEVYQSQFLDTIQVFQYARTGFPFELPDPSKLLAEARKVLQQAVIEVGVVTLDSVSSPDYDVNANSRIERYSFPEVPDPCDPAVVNCDPEWSIFDSLPKPFGQDANIRILDQGITGMALAARIRSAANSDDSVIDVDASPGAGFGLNYGQIERLGQPIDRFTTAFNWRRSPSAQPQLELFTDTSFTTRFRLPFPVARGDLAFSGIGGFTGLSPGALITMIVHPQLFQIMSHEVGHNYNLTHVCVQNQNLMTGTCRNCTELRFRPLPAGGTGAECISGSVMQWNQVNRIPFP